MSTPLNTHESWTSWIESGHWAESSDTAMPMLPAIAGDVMGLAMDPEVSIARIARVIAKDQVLATRVLRLANSAYCAPTQAITTVNDAIGTAYLARLLAERLGTDLEEAFMCGLLHDIGKLLLLKLSRDFIKHGVPTPSAQEIESAYSARHSEMGALLMRHWKLPEALVEPVQFHHDPDSAPTHTREATITYVANRLSHRYGFGCPTDDANLLEDEIAVRAGLTESMLGDLDRRAPGLFQVARQIVA